MQLAKPTLSESVFKTRIGLVRSRTHSYPMDTLDFIMMDLERPPAVRRHADQCLGDLTGRVLEVWSALENIDGKKEEHLTELFNRILRTRQPSGLFGIHQGQPTSPTPVEDGITSAPSRLFPALVRYWQSTGDSRGLDAAMGIAEFLFANEKKFHEHFFTDNWYNIENWVVEPMALLYGATHDPRCLDFIRWHLERTPAEPSLNTHSHGYTSTMRGFQLAAIYSGDMSFNEKPEHFRQHCIAEHFPSIDGGVSELYPRSFRNEGCSISDWLMLNLNAGLLGAKDAYHVAENTLWNALFFNQFITGGFGHRDQMETGYRMGSVSEAWWCCTHHAGLAMSEVARHVVTERDGKLHVNMLIPGTFRIGDAEVVISTIYPQNGEAFITTKNCGMPLEIDIPECIKKPTLKSYTAGNEKTIRLSGKVGYTLQVDERTKMNALRYGPLILAPMKNYWNRPETDFGKSVPAGYIPPMMPAGLPTLEIGEPDEDGLYPDLRHIPYPDWSFFEAGAAAPLGFRDVSGYVNGRFPNGEEKVLFFTPMCYLTSNLTFFDVPILFPAKEK